MHTLLNELASCVAEHLQANLPLLDPNWWQHSVIDRLSIQQQRIAEEKHLNTLASLDLACLLRVFDQNWHELNAVARLPFDARNWLKEAQSIRNRWAHLPPSGLPLEDHYRDADTVQRLMVAIGANQQSICRTRKYLDALRQALGPNAPTKRAPQASAIDLAELRPGAMVMAKLKHASFEWLDPLQTIIENFQGGEAKVRIRLAGEEQTISWQEKHFRRLIALWEKA